MRANYRALAAFLALAAAAVPSGTAPAQPAGFEGMRRGSGAEAGVQPALNDGRPAALEGVGIDQRLGERMPLDIPFLDENGNAVTLEDYFGNRPVVLSLVYYNCPMLCTQVLNGVVSSLKGMNLEAGKDYDLLTVSFNPDESPDMAMAKKRAYVSMSEKMGIADHWHFLTGSEESIRRAADAVGFRYRWDEETQQYAHASGITILNPDGTISRYLFGVEYAPRDLRLAIVESSNNKVGTLADQLLLFCFHYDPVAGKYGAAAIGILRIAAAITLAGLFGLIFVLVRRERRQNRAPLATGSGIH